MIDSQLADRSSLQKELNNVPVSQPNAKVPIISLELIKANIDTLVHALKISANPSKVLWFNIAREMVQKIIVSPSPDNTCAELTIHSRLATIMASMVAWEKHSKIYYQQASEEYLSL